MDDDGVDAAIEDAAPHHGDNNEDGIADSLQPNVATLPAAVDVDENGTLDDYVSIVSPEGTSLRAVTALEIPADNPPPEGVHLPYGLFDYEVVVANAGDAAEVTYVTPAGFVPSGVHFLQNGEWTDLADRTDIDAKTGDVTVSLQDGGAGDETRVADGVIVDPSGPSAASLTITTRVVSGAGAPNFAIRLEECNSGDSGNSCNGAEDFGTSAGLGSTAAWNWADDEDAATDGDDGDLTYGRNYRLVVETSLPASGWTLTGRACTVGGSSGAILNGDAGANGIIVRLADVAGQRLADCTFTFAQPAAPTITVHKKGDRTGATVSNLQNATFPAYSNSTYTTAVAGASCVTNASGVCQIPNLSANTTYWVRETTAPANFQRIDSLTQSSSGSAIYGQQLTTGAAGSNVDSRDFANRRINPAFPNECGINIALVMDLSNSITTGQLADMKTSAKAFVDALEGTPSSVAGYTFATNAPADGPDLALTNVSGSGGADTARDWIDTRAKPGGGDGGTNWDAGFRQLVGAAGSYDIVVFLTDGNPTFYGSPQSGGTGSDTTFREVEEGVFSSNAVKAANPELKVVGVAIGAGASTNNIAAVSGPVEDDDYFLAANFVDLQNKLEEIASNLCGGTVTVKKQVEGPSGFAPAGGWQFSVPSSMQVIGVTAPVTGVTPAFDVTPGAVTITENLAAQPGYTLVQTGGKNATCTRNGSPVAAGDITNVANGISLNVGALDIVACEFKNTPTKSSIQIA
ncbi:MAG: choice-of-anchor U domain-containing protein, partial [Acidimicrobiia bacterium]